MLFPLHIVDSAHKPEMRITVPDSLRKDTGGERQITFLPDYSGVLLIPGGFISVISHRFYTFLTVISVQEWRGFSLFYLRV